MKGAGIGKAGYADRMRLHHFAIAQNLENRSQLGCGKVTPHNQQCVNFEATRGAHISLVTAAGMEPYKKTIEVTGAGKNWQAFFIELKSSDTECRTKNTTGP